MQIHDRNANETFELNLAPMIDVVFLLLIFFMVATTFVQHEKEMELDLPEAQTGEDVDRTSENIVINLLQDGRVIVDGQELDQNALIERLTRAARANPETPVTIRGDRKVYHEHVVAVMDACRIAGLLSLEFASLDG